MQWTVLASDATSVSEEHERVSQDGERSLYDSEWVRLHLADVEVPGLRRFDHHVVRVPAEASGVVVLDPARGVLLLWRHRFITDTWGWEVPAGRIERGELPGEAALREVLEETGWRPTGALEPLVSYHPANGISDLTFHLYTVEGAEYVGDPSDPSEAERVAWVPQSEVREMVLAGAVPDGLTLTALLFAMGRGLI
jgi:8-oxo-dGTP pyrophosphatase MutT (NUDIX family)